MNITEIITFVTTNGDVILGGILGILGGLAVIAKLTTTTKDDEVIGTATTWVSTVKGFFTKTK